MPFSERGSIRLSFDSLFAELGLNRIGSYKVSGPQGDEPHTWFFLQLDNSLRKLRIPFHDQLLID
jgi:hypothetical protein